jgi:hypothetical protein
MRPNLRKVALMDFIEGGYVSPECLVLRPRRDDNGEFIIDPTLLASVLRSDLVFGQLMHLIAGIGRPRINGTDVKQVKIPVPSSELQSSLRRKFIDSIGHRSECFESHVLAIFRSLLECQLNRWPNQQLAVGL